eukprot:jgi/Mesvir1/2210/Mv09855-RA.1
MATRAGGCGDGVVSTCPGAPIRGNGLADPWPRPCAHALKVPEASQPATCMVDVGAAPKHGVDLGMGDDGSEGAGLAPAIKGGAAPYVHATAPRVAPGNPAQRAMGTVHGDLLREEGRDGASDHGSGSGGDGDASALAWGGGPDANVCSPVEHASAVPKSSRTFSRDTRRLLPVDASLAVPGAGPAQGEPLPAQRGPAPRVAGEAACAVTWEGAAEVAACAVPMHDGVIGSAGVPLSGGFEGQGDGHGGQGLPLLATASGEQPSADGATCSLANHEVPAGTPQAPACGNVTGDVVVGAATQRVVVMDGGSAVMAVGV